VPLAEIRRENAINELADAEHRFEEACSTSARSSDDLRQRRSDLVRRANDLLGIPLDGRPEDALRLMRALPPDLIRQRDDLAADIRHRIPVADDEAIVLARVEAECGALDEQITQLGERDRSGSSRGRSGCAVGRDGA